MMKMYFAALALAAVACVASAHPVATSTREDLVTRVPEATEVTAYRFVEPMATVKVRRAQTLTAAEQIASQALPVVELLRADQYALRQIDRQRPEVTPAWRECPSV